MEEVINILQARFPDAVIRLEKDDDSEYINGNIVWAGFRDVSFLERQRLVYNPLRDALGDRAQQVSMVFTYTPNEYEQLKAA